MRVILCNIDPFIYVQPVYFYDGHSQTQIGEAPIEQLSQFIVNQCNEFSVSDVTLTGIKQYTNEVATKIVDYSKTKYSRTINVTVR